MIFFYAILSIRIYYYITVFFNTIAVVQRRNTIRNLKIIKNNFPTSTFPVWKIAILLSFLFSAGCATTRDDIGADVYKELNADKYTIESTDNLIEKNYDAKTLLRRGEAYFDKKSYIEARGEYNRFINLHPYHKYIPHVHHRIAMSFLNEFKSIDRNSEPLREALSQFTLLTQNYPDNKYSKDAESKIINIKNQLAEIDYYIASYYFKKNSYKAAIPRFNFVLNATPTKQLKEKALFFLGVSYQKEGKKEEAGKYLKKLVKEFPEGSFTGKAKLALMKL